MVCDLSFFPFKGEKIPKSFSFLAKNKPLVDFFNKSASSCTKNVVSKIFVIKDENNTFLGYVALALKSFKKDKLSPPKSRGVFDRPALVIGQLLIDENFRRKGFGKTVLKWVIAVSRIVSVFVPLRLLIVEALNDEAREYYEARGFKGLPDDPYVLVLDLKPILNSI